MQILARGAAAGMRGALERAAVAWRLLNGQDDVTDYVNGVCYDAAAFVRYLLGAAITPNQLIQTSGQAWRGAFNFPTGVLWHAGAIPAGTAVGFLRQADQQFFHAGIAVGHTRIRAINGGLLGAGWSVPCDLATRLQPDANGWSPFDGTQVQVWLSPL